MSSPHDALFRHTFSQPEHAAALFRSKLPAEVVAVVDWGSLTLEPGSFVDDELTWRHADLLFRVSIAGKEAYLYLLVEHQSAPHPLMPLRLLHYVARIWDTRVRQNANLKHLPAVFPLVVYHGATAWNEAVTLGELIDLDDVLKTSLAAHLPQLHMALDDLSTQTESELRSRALSHLGTLTALCLQRLSLTLDPIADLRRLFDLFAAVTASPRGLDALTAILQYVFEVAEPEPTHIRQLLAPLGPTAEVSILSTADKLREQGRREGEARGETRGRAAALLKQLQLKFGNLDAAASERVHAASIDELDRWAERILSATSVDDTLR